MSYVTLIELAIRHAYYTSGSCTDFTIVPSDDTQRILRNHRCLMNVSGDALRIVCPVDAAGAPFLSFAANTVLRFALRLLNPDFALFTDLTGLAPSSTQPMPLYTNVGLAAEANGQLALTTSSTRTPESFADVELALPALSASGAVQPGSYTINFSAKRSRWAFYCVTDLTTGISELRIVDASPSGTTEVLLFSDTNRTDLEASPDPTDGTAVLLRSQYPTLHLVRLISDDLIACRQQPRKYLELRRGDERLVGALPNPSLRDVAKEDLLFRIIKYRTQPFLTQ